MALEVDYLRAVLSTSARVAFPVEVLAKLISPIGDGRKQIIAYNLCDGTRTQAQIAAKASLDHASLSRSMSRWVDEGIVVRVGGFPLHVYPLPQSYKAGKPRKKDAGQSR